MKTAKLTTGARGYLNLKALKGAPDFRTVKHAEVLGHIGDPIIQINLNKGEAKAGAMLKKGYLAVGLRSEEVIVEYDNHHVVVTPALGGDLDPQVDPVEPAKAEEAVAAQA